LTKDHLIFLRLEADGLRLLPRGTRREIAEMLCHSPKTDRFSRSRHCTSNRGQVGSPTGREPLKVLARIARLVVSAPEIMRGTPVFKGTRIPVDLIADMLAQGATPEEIIEGYPALDKEKVVMAALYMRAFPRRGRPDRRPWQVNKPRGRESFALDGLLMKA